MSEHSKEENEVYQVQCYFKTNIEDSSYHAPETVITLESDFTRTKLNKIIHKLLENSIPENTKFEFLINGEMLREKLDNMMQKHHISNDETVEIIYTFSMHKPKEDQKLENDEWIKTINTAFDIDNSNTIQPMAVGFFDGTVKIYDQKFNIVYNKQLHQDVVNDIVFNRVDENNYVLITAGNDEEMQLHKITEDRDKWQDNRYAMIMDNTTCMSFCPTNPEYLTYAGEDSLVKILSINNDSEDNKEKETKPHKRVKTDLAYLKPTASIEGNKNQINCIKWINNSDIVTGGYDHAIRLFNADREELSRSMFTNNKTVT